MKTWLDPHPVSVPTPILETVGGNSLVSEILVHRGMTDLDRIQAFLNPDLYEPASPYDLDHMQAAIDRLSIALEKGQRICVWGDFDVDGQTATTLLVSSLRKLGGEVQYHIPLRSKESHGVNLPVLKEIIAGGIDLLLTCDTGIGAHEPVDYAQSQGVDVIISDHHDLPPELPPATAVINPKRCAPDHPLANLPGVGVAYQIARALFDEMGQAGGAEQHLDLVALGIVADLALQGGDVRYLLQRGLERLRNPERLGLQVMMELAEIDPAGLTEEHIGFEIGPRLNALGRLGDANQAVEFLTTADKSQARLIANHLEGLNAHRKLITSQVFGAAQGQIEADPSLLRDSALVLANPTWPGGVIGIVASRLVERYNKPALLITAPAGEVARGSARSIPGVDISAAIAAQQDLLVGFGGHPMAAGFSLQEERIPEFRRAISETVGEMLSGISYKPTLQIDAYLPLADISLELVADLERLAPFGQGNPNPVLVSRGLRYKGAKDLGRSGDHLLVRLEDQAGLDFKAVWWGGGIEPLPEWIVSGAALDLAYSVRSRDFQGKKEVQVEWLEARPVESEHVEVVTKPREIEVIDHRESPAPVMELKALYANKENLSIWAEAGAKDALIKQGVETDYRSDLEAAGELVIWTIPPGWQALNSALENASPAAVHLFAADPGMDQVKPLTERLLGLAKYALRKTKGRVRIASLAAATAQREETATAGLQWLAARGYLTVIYETEGNVCISEGDGEAGDLERVEKRLRELLGETAAFRRYYSSADADLLIKQTLEQ
jgi:single-stranded-DNA-specific exonuclease